MKKMLVIMVMCFALLFSVNPAAADMATTHTDAALFRFMGTPSTNLGVIGATDSDAGAWDPWNASAISQSSAWLDTALINTPMLDIAYTRAGVESIGVANGFLAGADVSGFVAGGQEVAVGSFVTNASGINLAGAAFHSDDLSLFNAGAGGIAELEQTSMAYQFITPFQVEAGIQLSSQSYALGEDTMAAQFVAGETGAMWGGPGLIASGDTTGMANNFGNGYAQTEQFSNVTIGLGSITSTAVSDSQSGNF